MKKFLRRSAPCLLALVLASGASTRVAAQSAADATRGRADDSADALTDVIDLWHRLRHREPADSTEAQPWDYRKPMVAIVPTIGSRPSTGLTVGAAASLAVFFGDPATTLVSSMLTGVSVSTKKQASVAARFDAFSANDIFRAEGDNRFQWTSQDSAGLGIGSISPDAVNARFTNVRIFEALLHRLGGGLYAGGGIYFATHRNIRPGTGSEAIWEGSAPVVYARTHGFDERTLTSAGVGATVKLDTRNNPVNASKGWLASASYRPYFQNFLGGDSSWQEVVADLRHYVTGDAARPRTLAVWLYGDFVTRGVAPYFDLPAIGMDTYGRSGRGYTEGQFRGERLVYGEIEYRQTLRRDRLLGLVVFANTTTVSNRQEGEQLFDAFASAAGAGLRVLFNKRSGANLCVDLAWGRNGSRGLYLALQEAF